MRARTALVNTARGLAKSYGERLRGGNVSNMNPEKSQGLSPELRTALEPLLGGIESLSERIRECKEGIERLAPESYLHSGCPTVSRLNFIRLLLPIFFLASLALTQTTPTRIRSVNLCPRLARLGTESNPPTWRPSSQAGSALRTSVLGHRDDPVLSGEGDNG